MVSSRLRSTKAAAENRPEDRSSRKTPYAPTGIAHATNTSSADGIDWAMASSCACPTQQGVYLLDEGTDMVT